MSLTYLDNYSFTYSPGPSRGDRHTTTGVTPWTLWPDHFFSASRFFVFSSFITLFCLVPCGTLSWLFISFLANVNVVYRIVSYRTAYAVLAWRCTVIIQISVVGPITKQICDLQPHYRLTDHCLVIMLLYTVLYCLLYFWFLFVILLLKIIKNAHIITLQF